MPPFHVDVENEFNSSSDGFMLTIHGKPAPKKRYNPIRRYNPSKAAQDQFAFQAKHLFGLHGVELSTVNFGEAELEASFKFYLPRPKKSGKITQPPDVDNLVKFVQDAFEKNFYVNDSQFTKIAAEKNYDASPGNSVGYTIISIAKRVVSVED